MTSANDVVFLMFLWQISSERKAEKACEAKTSDSKHVFFRVFSDFPLPLSREKFESS
jgi:hypothetical protein